MSIQPDSSISKEAVSIRKRMPALVPPRLVPGDRVAVISPASRPANASVLQRCIRIVEDWGLKAVPGAHALSVYGSMAGRDSERLNDFTDAFLDESIKAIFFLSGGWGSLRLVSLLNYDMFFDSQKILMGCGENTSLLAAINSMTGTVVFNGPNLDQVTSRYTHESIKQFLFHSGSDYSITCGDTEEDLFEFAPYSPFGGIVEGVTLGGNLSALSYLSGTSYMPSFKDGILLLEDANEFNGALERWFTNLKLSGKLSLTNGIAFGAFENCGGKGAENSLPIQDAAGDVLTRMEKPCLFGLKFGQTKNTNVVPMGLPARLDTHRGTLQYLSPAFS